MSDAPNLMSREGVRQELIRLYDDLRRGVLSVELGELRLQVLLVLSDLSEGRDPRPTKAI